MRKVLIIAAAIMLLAACQSDLTGVTIPTPGSVAGAWSGTARWTGTQAGGAGADGAATAAVFQSGASILGGSSWQVTGAPFTAGLTGTIDDEGNIFGVTSLTVPCPATASFGGSLSPDGSQMTIEVSFSDPGTTPCGGAPVALVLSFAR